MQFRDSLLSISKYRDIQMFRMQSRFGVLPQRTLPSASVSLSYLPGYLLPVPNHSASWCHRTEMHVPQISVHFVIQIFWFLKN